MAQTTCTPCSLIDVQTRSGQASWQVPKVSALAKVAAGGLVVAVNIHYDRSNQGKQQKMISASASQFCAEAKRTLNLKASQVLLRARIVGLNTIYGKAHHLEKLLGRMGVRLSRRGLMVASSLVERNYDNSISSIYNEYDFGTSLHEGEDLLLPVSLFDSTSEKGKFESKFITIELLAAPLLLAPSSPPTSVRKAAAPQPVMVAAADLDVSDHLTPFRITANNIKVDFKGVVPPGPTGTVWKWELELEFEIHNSIESLGEELYDKRVRSQAFITLDKTKTDSTKRVTFDMRNKEERRASFARQRSRTTQPSPPAGPGGAALDHAG